MLKTVGASSVVASLANPLLSQVIGIPTKKSALTVYLESLLQPEGGYAWHVEGRSHLTPTFAVAGCYRLLQEMPPERKRLADFIRSHHPSQIKKLEQEHREFEFQQIQSLAWLGEDTSSFRETAGAWTKPLVYLKQYERHGWPIFAHEMAVIMCYELVGLPAATLEKEYLPYLRSRRRPDGSFNNAPSDDGDEGHVINTLWGLQALRVFGRLAERKTETIAWLQACQLANGAFTWQPKPHFGGVGDAGYTWAALRGLALLGAQPINTGGCVEFLLSLRNADGGFGDRPGWLSNPVASFYALDALETLGQIGRIRSTPNARGTASRQIIELSGNLKAFSIQLEAHGQGSPADAVHLAKSLRIHLWGAKNASRDWLLTAQSIADHQGTPVTFFHANEEYGTWVDHPGFGTYSHTSDVIAPPNADFGPSLAANEPVTWPEFRERRLPPLHEAGGRLVWQFGENEALARLLLDDSIERGGYCAISTFHFGNPDFTNSEPFLLRFRGQIPFVALQDAHGNEPWWFSDMTEGFRTVFIGKEPTWSDWLQALKHNWVAAVRHDAVSGHKTWIHSGSPEVSQFLLRQEREWRWWDNPGIQRPLVSVVLVRPEDKFEVARPERGVNLRVRCAWTNTTQGRPRQPLVELVSLTLEGKALAPKLVTLTAAGSGSPLDHYHTVGLPDSLSGEYTVGATVRSVATGKTSVVATQLNL